MVKQHYKKERKLMDTQTSFEEIVQHALANFLFGLTNGLVILVMILGIEWLILGIYFLHKLNESKIFNRNKYTSKLGKRYIYPIPSTLGFYTAYKLSEVIQTWLN